MFNVHSTGQVLTVETICLHFFERDVDAVGGKGVLECHLCAAAWAEEANADGGIHGVLCILFVLVLAQTMCDFCGDCPQVVVLR